MFRTTSGWGWLFIFSSLLVLNFSFADAEKESTDIPRKRLTDVLEKNLTGADLSNYPRSKKMSFESQAEIYLKFLKEKLSAKELASLMSNCLARPEENIFCDFVINNWQWDNNVKSRWDIQRERYPLSLSRTESKTFLDKGDFKRFERVARIYVGRGLYRVRTQEDFEKIADQLLGDSNCHSAALYTAFGVRAENYFPEEKFKKMAMNFYERSLKCGDPQDEETITAQYRYSLLNLLEGKCDKVEKHLKAMADDEEGNFTTRGLYWQAWCAIQEGDNLRYSVLRNRLLKQNPLSYHSLSINNGRVFEIINLIQDRETYVQMRTPNNPKINKLLTVIELLQKEKAYRVARKFLNYAIHMGKKLDPEFKLYLAILAKRNQDKIHEFRILSNLFREEPTLITLETLRVFYPLERFQTLKSHRKQVDPYLVAALIRQESGFVAHARSPAGALGLMQLMPGTARSIARVSRRQILNPRTNIKLGVRYFRGLLNKFSEDTELALAAYNAGPVNVERWKKRYQTDNRILFLDLIPFKETRNYVALIGRNYFWYLSLYAPQNLEIDTRIAMNPPNQVQRTPSHARPKTNFSAFETY